MDIDLLKAWRKTEQKKRRERLGDLLFMPFGIVAAVCIQFELLYERRFGKLYAIFIKCTQEQRHAVLWSLKNALGLPYKECEMWFGRNIPGPIFYGSREAIEWLVARLQAANVPCHALRVHSESVEAIQLFHFPMVNEISVAEAYKDHRLRIENINEFMRKYNIVTLG